MTVIGYIIIPLLTISYAGLASLSQENFTGIANQFHLVWLLFLWSLLIISFFLKTSFQLFSKHDWQPVYLKPLSLWIMLSGLASPLIPYQPQSQPLQSLHVFLSLTASIAFLMLVRLFLAYLQQVEPTLYQKLIYWFNGIVMTSVILLISYGHINSLIEAYLSCTLSIFLTYSNQIG